MSKFEKLSRAEMKNVIGGTAPIGADGDCTHDCVCSDGSHKEAKLTGCAKDTCSSDASGVTCTVGNSPTSRLCVNICPAS
ncbi:hypothetical protein [Mucilaginibacter sp.]|uniref:hypothetical protein n=1 Tax=Mucilaginibacter sp. TaxID=1882438 RepID=UPI0025DF44FA|nr:hypothetical protein [Mucilaginibacter sp.]